MITEAKQKVGNEGVITVGEVKSLDTELDILDGMRFGGYLSPCFITNAENMGVELDDPYWPAASSADIDKMRFKNPTAGQGHHFVDRLCDRLFLQSNVAGARWGLKY